MRVGGNKWRFILMWGKILVNYLLVNYCVGEIFRSKGLIYCVVKIFGIYRVVF